MNALNRKSVVAAQVWAQQQVAAEHQFSQATLNALHEYVGVIDATGILVKASDQWRNLGAGDAAAPEAIAPGGNYLLACESATGRYGEQAARLALGLRAVLRGEADAFEMESARQLGDTALWIYSRVRRFTVDGTVYAAISHEDITERRMGERELQDLRARHWHSERITQMAVLIASVAHELSQPLTAILTNAQAGLRFLSGSAPDIEEIRDILGDIIADDRRAGEIIESLRIMLLRQKTHRKPADVSDIVYDVIKLLHSEFVRQQVQVRMEQGEWGCVALVDRTQIQQVVLNLMMNAIDAMLPVAARQRRLRVSVAPSDNAEVLIRVRDSGVGITQEKVKKVFEAFWTTKARGTGMGLAICHSIVESHGGRIWVERNDDAGSTFFVALPSADAANSVPPRPLPAEAPDAAGVR